MPPDLLEFQRGFALALDRAGDRRYGGLSQHRLHGAVEALRANYPVVEQIVGAEMFEAVAVDYATDVSAAEPGARALRRAVSGLAWRAEPGSRTCLICPTSRGSKGCTSRA